MSLPVPGYDVLIADQRPQRSVRSDAGIGFMVGEAERGPEGWVFASNFDQFVQAVGDRVAYSYVHDAAETAFREGLSGLFFSRDVSTGALAATNTANDAQSTPAPSLVFKAKSKGAWGNSLRRNVAAGTVSGYKITIKRVLADTTTVVLDTSPDLATQQDAVDWSARSEWVTITLGSGTNPPATTGGDVALTGGTDDRTTVSDATFAAALGRFTPDLGPGQVAAPGRTTDAAHLALVAHASANNRHALLDLPDSPTLSTVRASARAADVGAAARSASAYWPWAVIPPLTGSSATRVVPWSAVQLGLFARNDARGNPNHAAAGEEFDAGVAQFAIGTSQDTTSLLQSDFTALNDDGVNVARTFYGLSNPVQYGNRTLRTQLEDALWTQASGSRCIMAFAARGGAVVRRYVHSQVDGKGWTIGRLQGELVALAQEFLDVGAIYGTDVGDAALIDTGPDTNPPAQLQTGLLVAKAALRVSPGADHVTLKITRVPITEALA